MISAQDQLESFLNRRASLFTAIIRRLIAAHFEPSDYNPAIAELADALGKTMTLSDLNGRRRILMEADRAAKRARFAEADTPVASLPFEEAVEDILSREPRLAESAEEIAALYSEGKTFAMARSVSEIVTARVQELIGKSIVEGSGIDSASKAIRELGDWSAAYADTVYRTNVATAYSRGRQAQAQRPAVKEIAPAFEFLSIRDSRTRENHAAAHGLVAPTDDPIWRVYRPPLGWQCRCVAELVSRWELERRGLIGKDGSVARYSPPNFHNAHPDKGFKAGVLSW